MSKPRKITAEERARLNATFGLAAAPKAPDREPNGRRQRPSVTESAEDAMATALQARNRVRRVDDTPEQRMASKAALMGSGVGMCIDAIHDGVDARRNLWGIWQAVCAAKWNYRTRILGTTGTAKGAAIGFIPERMETNQSATVDTRTADEKDAAAIKADAYWRGLYDKLPTPAHKWALRPAMDEVEGALWRDGKPTQTGRTAVAALVILLGMHERR